MKWIIWRFRLAYLLFRFYFTGEPLVSWLHAAEYRDYFDDGYTPRDAFNEDMSYAD